MKASVMLDKLSKYEILELDAENKGSTVLLLHKSTETGSPFLVVAGYFLTEVGKFEQSVLAEIETVPASDYTKLKSYIRKTLKAEEKVPITFW